MSNTTSSTTTTTTTSSSTTTSITVVTLSTITTTTTSSPGSNMTNSTADEQTQWEFLLSAFIIMVIATVLCGSIIWVCKTQTKEAREKREAEEQEKEDERKRFEQEMKAREQEDEKLREEKEEQIRRELEEQEEIENARKEGREVDPVYNRDDIFYANIADVPVVVEHPSSLVETGVQALDHTGKPKPRSGDKSYSAVKTTDKETGMVNEKHKTAPNVMGMRVINGVDFYRNQYEKTIAQQKAREQADRVDQARKNNQPYSYRQMFKNKRNNQQDDDDVGLGEDFSGGNSRGGGDDDDYARRGPNAVISELPWIGKQNLSAFDPDAFEKAFADLPDDDEQEEMDKKKLAGGGANRTSIHARVTGQVLVAQDDNDDGGGGYDAAAASIFTRRTDASVADAKALDTSAATLKKQKSKSGLPTTHEDDFGTVGDPLLPEVEDGPKKKYKSRTDGGGGASMFSLLEAPAIRKEREEAEAAARRNDMIEKQKYAKLVDQANKPKKKGQARVVIPPEPPKSSQKVLIVNPNLKEDKEAYYAALL